MIALRLLIVTVGILAACAPTAHADQKADPPIADLTCDLEIDARNPKIALTQLGAQCDVSILVKNRLPRYETPVQFSGTYTVQRALDQILVGRVARIEYTGSRIITVIIGPEIPPVRTPPRMKPVLPPKRTQKELSREDPLRRLDRMEVVGTRYQNDRIIAHKRANAIISDVLAQDEIGRLPDFNISDASQRLPGVLNIRDEEEGISLGLRGLSPEYLLITIDGRTMATEPSLDTRQDFVEILPSSLFERVEALKTRTAGMDGNTIGGQINFVTRSAYRAKGPFLNLSGIIGHFTADDYDSAQNGPAIRLDGTMSNTFGDHDQFGLVLSGSYFSREQDEARALNYYDNDYVAPTFSIWNGIEDPLERYGLFGKFEYRPSSRLAAEVSGLRFEQEETFERASTVISGAIDNRIDGAGFDGLVRQVSGGMEHLISRDRKHQNLFQFKVDMWPGDNISFRFAASHGEGRAEEGDSSRSDITFDYVGPSEGFDYGYSYGGAGVPPQHVFLNPAIAEDLDNYALSTIERDISTNSGSANDLEASLTRSFDGLGLAVTGGVRYRTSDHAFDKAGYDYFYVGSDPQLLSQYGRLSAGYRPPYGPINAAVFDYPSVLAFWQANPGLFEDRSNPDNLIKSDFGIEEDILAAYLAVDYTGERLQAHAGLRSETTNVSAYAFGRINGVLARVTDSNDYTNLLPSLGVSYDLSPALKLRAAYSQALGRANYPDLNPSRTETEASGVTRISGGNTRLDPRLANNYDLSLEYYFDEGRSLASAAIFYKAIDDEIFTLQTETRVNGAPVITTQPVNADETTLSGIELNLIKDRLGFLPGPLADLGISANYTYVTADAKVLAADGTGRSVGFLTEQPEHLANLALFYQHGPFEGRVSYNYTGEFATAISPTNPDDDAFINAFETIDAQARWRLNSHLTLMAEGRNLTNEKSTTLVGPGKTRTEDFSIFGKAFFIGLTYSY